MHAGIQKSGNIDGTSYIDAHLDFRYSVTVTNSGF
jgi:hypothetical protein